PGRTTGSTPPTAIRTRTRPAAGFRLRGTSESSCRRRRLFQGDERSASQEVAAGDLGGPDCGSAGLGWASFFMSHFLGIDGGGTRTTAWLADERKRVLGRSVAGASNPLKVGFAAAEREVLRAARAAFRDAGLRFGNLEAVCVGLAGVDR